MSRSKAKRQDKVANHHGPRRLAIALAVALACQVAFLLAYRAILGESYVRRARHSYSKGDFAAAGKWARAAATLNPSQGYAAFFEGLVARRKADDRRAADRLRQSLRTIAHRAPALRELGACEEKIGRPRAAIAYLAEALAIEPLATDAPSARARLGRLLLAERHLADAAAQFRSAVADSPQSRYIFDGLAVAWGLLGADQVAAVCAAVLLVSTRYVEAGCRHALRLGAKPPMRDLMVAVLKAASSKYDRGTREHKAVESTLKELANP